MRVTATILITILFFWACDDPTNNDCLQTEGEQVSELISLPFFNKINFGDRIRVVLNEGSEQRVEVQTGENLRPDIVLRVADSTLIVNDFNSCNVVRDYAATTVFVTAPDITQIRNASRFEIRSDGVLSFPSLELHSNTNDQKKSGDFYLTLNTQQLRVVANGISVFYIDGSAQSTQLIFSDELPRFEGANLAIQNLTFLQRSANDIIVNPQVSIIGEIRGVGNVICLSQPEIIEVETFFTGQLIFPD